MFNKKVGARYRLKVHHFNATTGDIVTLEMDDGTENPRFTDGSNSWYINWCFLEPVVSKPIVGGKIL